MIINVLIRARVLFRAFSFLFLAEFVLHLSIQSLDYQTFIGFPHLQFVWLLSYKSHGCKINCFYLWKTVPAASNCLYASMKNLLLTCILINSFWCSAQVNSSQKQINVDSLVKEEFNKKERKKKAIIRKAVSFFYHQKQRLAFV